MKTKTCLFWVFTLQMTFGVYAQQVDSLQVQKLEEVTVSDSRFPLKRSQSGKIIFRTDAEALKKMPGQNIAAVLDRVAGIEINGSGSHPGQNLGYAVRGSRNRQVLILIDGVQVSDPSSIANDFDLRLLSTDQVASMEVMKGASSTLYGTGAAAAIINITLKNPEETPFSGMATWAFGTNQAQKNQQYRIDELYQSYAISGSTGRFSYLASLNYQDLEGLSAIDTEEDQPDDFSRLNILTKLGYQFSEHFKLGIFGNFDRFESDFDESFGLLDADHFSESSNYRTGLTADWEAGAHTLHFSGAFQAVDRDVESSFPGRFNATSWVGDLYNKWVLRKDLYIVAGINVQQNDMESADIPFGETRFVKNIQSDNAQFTLVDFYANAVYLNPNGWQVNAGGRLNTHSEYGNHGVFNVNPSYTFTFGDDNLRVLTSFSTAFITPSLFQLFAPDFGNQDLSPERNETFEAGLEFNRNQKHRLSVVYFNRVENDFIDFVTINPTTFESQYQNVPGSFTAEGVEIDLKITAIENLTLSGNYSHTDRKKALRIRIPANKVNLSAQYTLLRKTNLTLSYQYTDARDDVFFSPDTFASENKTLDAYSLLDFFVSHQIDKRFRLFGSVTNIFNEEYEEIFGFTTRGNNVRLGLEMRF
ncbi:MAG: TonB-dependent receptor [Bacteroidetes bacterium]|nr:TonB-dependent receptor [Bacteroidota bacterium]